MYTVYKTINLVNGKFYIGVHKTDNEDDDYLGSGKLISRAIKKYKFKNFRKEILGRFEDAKSAYELEAKLVTPELVESYECYNMKRGGEGGFDYLNTSGLNTKRDMSKNNLGGIACCKKFGSVPNASLGCKLSLAKRKEHFPEGTFKGRKHSEETKFKMSLARKKRKLIGSNKPLNALKE